MSDLIQLLLQPFSFGFQIIGQAIVGALHQTCREAHQAGRSRAQLVENLTRFLTRALKPD